MVEERTHSVVCTQVEALAPADIEVGSLLVLLVALNQVEVDTDSEGEIQILVDWHKGHSVVVESTVVEQASAGVHMRLRKDVLPPVVLELLLTC